MDSNCVFREIKTAQTVLRVACEAGIRNSMNEIDTMEEYERSKRAIWYDYRVGMVAPLMGATKNPCQQNIGRDNRFIADRVTALA